MKIHYVSQHVDCLFAQGSTWRKGLQDELHCSALLLRPVENILCWQKELLKELQGCKMIPARIRRNELCLKCFKRQLQPCRAAVKYLGSPEEEWRYVAQTPDRQQRAETKTSQEMNRRPIWEPETSWESWEAFESLLSVQSVSYSSRRDIAGHQHATQRASDQVVINLTSKPCCQEDFQNATAREAFWTFLWVFIKRVH